MKYTYILRIVPDTAVEAKLHEMQENGYELVSIHPHVKGGSSLFALIARKPQTVSPAPKPSPPKPASSKPQAAPQSGKVAFE
jgi:hypothetical protein